MPSIILSDNGVSSGSAGLKSTAASDGALALQTTTAGGTATTAVTIDTSQNVGLGVTPSAWTLAPAFELKQSGVGIWNSGSNDLYLSNNAYYNSGWKYGTSGVTASQYRQVSGGHSWFNAPSGTAGNAITFTQAMTLDASGNLLVGATSNLATNRRELVMQGSTGALVSLGNNTTADRFQIASDSGENALLINKASTPMIFYTANTERIRIESGGNVGIGVAPKSKTTIQGQLSIGQTGTASAAAGIYLYANDSLSDNSFLCRVSNGTGTTTWYIGNQAITTSSDIRLKENVKPSERNALDLLNQWEIVDHTWNDPSDQCENNRNSRGVWTGVVAQQVQQVTPWLVNKPLEDVNEDGSINPWTMDFGYAVPLLVKAIQELKAELDTAKAEIAALKGTQP